MVIYDNKDSVAPLIYDRWIRNISAIIFKDRMNEEQYKFMPYKEGYGDRVLKKFF